MQKRKSSLFTIIFIFIFVGSGFADEIHDAAKNGDLANKQKEGVGPYHREIDSLADGQKDIDIAFLLAGAACGGGYEACVLNGDFYAIEKLSPKVVFPMHSGGNEHVYTRFAKDAAAANVKTDIIAAEFRGDRFFYQDGKIQ